MTLSLRLLAVLGALSLATSACLSSQGAAAPPAPAADAADGADVGTDPPGDDPKDPPGDDPKDPPGDGPKDPPCAAVAVACTSDAGCCTGICSAAGPDAPGVCLDPQPDGAFCAADPWCAGGTCTDGTCGAPTSCGGQGAGCWDGDGCCDGYVCALPGGLGEGTCLIPLDDGAACKVDSVCASGQCVQGTCGLPEGCLPEGESCWSSFDCCGASFCTGGQAYIPGVCASKRPLGSFCTWHDWCASEHCVEGVCVPGGCAEPAAACAADGDCCTGTCQAGVCADEAKPLGAACAMDEACASGWCDGGLCAEAPITFTELYDTVLVPAGCASGYCHGGVMWLGDVESAYWELVGRAAVEPGCDALARVMPFEPEQSTMWLRVRPAELDGGDPCLGKMPKGTDGLDPQDAQKVYDWIAAGAPK